MVINKNPKMHQLFFLFLEEQLMRIKFDNDFEITTLLLKNINIKTYQNIF